MRLAAFLVLSAAAVVHATVQKDATWLMAPVFVLLFLGLDPFRSPKSRKAVRRPATGAAAGTAVGAAGAVGAASWWADGHAHGGGTADASGGGGGDGGGGDSGGCGGCGGCGYGG